MVRSMTTIPVSFWLWLAMAGTATAQATVETGLGAARAVTSTAPAKGIGKSMSGLAGSLDKALKGGQESPSDQPAAVVPAKPATKTGSTSPKTSPAPAASWEDPGGIEPGLTYDELVRRFGPCFMAITAGAERSLSYRGKDGVFQVKVQDGVVASIENASARWFSAGARMKLRSASIEWLNTERARTSPSSRVTVTQTRSSDAAAQAGWQAAARKGDRRVRVELDPHGNLVGER